MVFAAIAAMWVGLSIPVSLLLSKAMRSGNRQLVSLDGNDAVYLLDDGSFQPRSAHPAA